MKFCMLFCLSMVFGGCTAREKSPDDTVSEKSKMKRLSAVSAQKLVKGRDGETAVLIDGRTPQMFAGGHIEGAVQIDAFAEGATDALKPFLARRQIILYCTTEKRSNALLKLLQEQQYAGEIVIIADGITGWKKAGYDLVVDREGA